MTSSLKKVLIWGLWKKLDWEYLETGCISARRGKFKKFCILFGITLEEIISVEDFIINEHYMKVDKYRVSKEISQLCSDGIFSQMKDEFKIFFGKLISIDV